MAIAQKAPAFSAASRPASPRGQRGVVLIIALVMMITITFAGLALFRQVGLGAVIIGNLAFKQGATSAADRGVEQARAWLINPNLASIAVLQGDTVSGIKGYYAASCYTASDPWGTGVPTSTDLNSSCRLRVIGGTMQAFDPLAYTWNDNTSTIALGPDTDANGLDSAGNTVRYVIHRLCNMDGSIYDTHVFSSGDQDTQACVLATGGRLCLDPGLAYAKECIGQSVQPYYRVTVRVQGLRNTLSFVEVVVF